jgi:hypothetical protein
MFWVDTPEGRMPVMIRWNGGVVRVSELVRGVRTGNFRQINRARYAGSGVKHLVVDGQWDMTQVQLLAQKYYHTIRQQARQKARSR